MVLNLIMAKTVPYRVFAKGFESVSALTYITNINFKKSLIYIKNNIIYLKL